jgi:hypothetical protein
MSRVDISVYPESHMKHTNTLYMQKVDFHHDEAGDACSIDGKCRG